jgi:hypothetical protein
MGCTIVLQPAAPANARASSMTIQSITRVKGQHEPLPAVLRLASPLCPRDLEMVYSKKPSKTLGTGMSILKSDEAYGVADVQIVP